MFLGKLTLNLCITVQGVIGLFRISVFSLSFYSTHLKNSYLQKKNLDDFLIAQKGGSDVASIIFGNPNVCIACNVKLKNLGVKKNHVFTYTYVTCLSYPPAA